MKRPAWPIPSPVAQTFFVDDEIASQLRLDSIVTLVDAKHAAAHIGDSNEAKEQIAFADTIIINKTDLAQEKEIAQLEVRVRAMNGAARIVRTQNANVPIDDNCWTKLRRCEIIGRRMQQMDHTKHEPHDHAHSENCGHTAVQHDGHTDYLHDGHMHHSHEGHVDEHELSASSRNPAECTSGHDCDSHAKEHSHSSSCGHETVPHAGHTDYVVAGHLHHQHGGHCDDHGATG